MHVCHVWDRFWPLEIGGLERYILWLSNYLSKNKDVNFSLITGRTKVLLVRKNIKKIENTSILKVYRLGPSPVDLVNGVFMYVFRSQPRIIKKMKFAGLCYEAARWNNIKSVDIFHIHGIWGDLEYINLGIYLSQRFRKPLVVTLHGGFVGGACQGGMPLETPIVKNILKNYVDAITTYSKEVLNKLQQMGLGEKSYHITNFVDTVHFAKHDTSDSHEDTVIYVGRLEPVQSPEVIIRAFKQVNAQFPNVKLQIVGYGSLYNNLKGLIHDLNLDKTIFLLGKQTNVRKFLWNSNIFVATDFGYIASLEAWSAGLAVIAPNFGILKETITHEHNGLIVESQNVDQLASAIIRLIEDKELRKKLALNGKEMAQNYDIRAVAPRMFEFYHLVTRNSV